MKATIRFHEDLEFFLSSGVVGGVVEPSFEVPGSIKDMIEACGVPHIEVGLILASGISVDFGHQVSDGDSIDVYPPGGSIDPSISKVLPLPVSVVRFVADDHLVRLARFLRLLGLDTLYHPGWADRDLVRVSIDEERILLTRDVGLLKHRDLIHGYYLRSTESEQQLIEVCRRFRPVGQFAPFNRCMACNGLLKAVAREEIMDRVPPGTSRSVDEFRVCQSCDRIFWRGAHHTRLERLVAAARAASE